MNGEQKKSLKNGTFNSAINFSQKSGPKHCVNSRGQLVAQQSTVFFFQILLFLAGDQWSKSQANLGPEN
jgi:hypothetical protein